MNALYPPRLWSDEEREAIDERLAENSRKQMEGWRKADEEKEAQERLARHRAEEAERAAKEAERQASEAAAIEAMSKADLVRLVWDLERRLEKLEGRRDRRPDVPQAGIQVGALANGVMHAPKTGLEPAPQRERSGWLG